MFTKDAKAISSPQSSRSNIITTEKACLLTPNRGDSSYPLRPSNNDKMSGYHYSSNGDGSSSYPRRERRTSRAGMPHSDHSYNGSFQAQSHSNYSAPNGQFGGFLPPMTPASYNSNPFGASPPLQFNPSGRSNSNLTSQSRVLLSAVSPGPVWPTEDQLDVAYSYGVRREDGSFTRLIRADRLPQLAHLNIPERQGPEGLIIVPEPRQPSPTRRIGAMPLVPGDVVAGLPIYDHNNPQAGALVSASGSQSPSVYSGNIRPYIGRREKIFCDKWIHEGVCAFTQMGCKYRHEMPLDKVTQVSLGLNHGLPIWYKRALAVTLHPTGALPASPPDAGSGSIAMASNSSRTAGNWRRVGGPSATAGGSSGSSRSASHGLADFGPIAPLTAATVPRNTGKLEKGEVEDPEDDDDFAYRARENRRR